MKTVGEHHVPAGPLAVRWLAHALPELRAGTKGSARVRLENAGSATWRSRDDAGVQLSSHWLDDRGNASVWDGPRTAVAHPVEPAATVEVELQLDDPQPPGPDQLAVDLVEENRFAVAEIGSSPLELPVDVRPRIDARRLAVVVHGRPLVFPVNFTLDGSAVVLRTDEGTTLHRARGEWVAFECDDADRMYHTGWSVLITGRAEEVRASEDLVRLQALPLGPWCPGPKGVWLRIRPCTITGRRILPHGTQTTGARERVSS